MQPPESQPPIPTPDGQWVPPVQQTEGVYQRSGCLSAFLVLMLIANPLMAALYLLSGSRIAATIPSFPAWAPPFLGVMALFNFACALGIWNGRKWGVYGFLASSAIVFVLNVATIGLASSLSGLIGVGILLVLLRDSWKHMK